MKPIRLITMGALALSLGILTPAFAQQDQGAKPEPQHEQHAKPEKHPAKPAKQDQRQYHGQQKPQQEQQHRANTSNRNEQRPAGAQQNHQRTQQHQQADRDHGGAPQGHWAHNGQRDSRGHVYDQDRFGRDHHAHFERGGGRDYDGHRAYSYGGYWFYADTWPAWFYDSDVYFVMGEDGLWYAVDYDDPSLMIQVNIE